MSDGTQDRPWVLKTPSGGSEFTAFRDDSLDPPALVVQVGKTELRYRARCLDDLHAMLTEHDDWMPLGSADEQKPAAEGTVEAWARSTDNPVGGWFGIKKGLRGRFGMYVPPLLEALGLAEPLAAAFASTFWWAVGISLLALIPATILALSQRRERSEAEPEAPVEPESLPV